METAADRANHADAVLCDFSAFTRIAFDSLSVSCYWFQLHQAVHPGASPWHLLGIS